MILAGDIGGTKTRLALFEQEDGRLQRRVVKTYRSADYAEFEETLQAFLDETRASVERACLGAPGPVIRGVVETTNLPWQISSENLARFLKLPAVVLVNDLVATAAAIPCLADDDVRTIHPGAGASERREDREQRCVVLAPGTGLGQAFLILRGDNATLHPSEGGHVDFAPTSEIQIELLRYLQKRFHRVSFERVLSGPGFENIYDFLKEAAGREEPPELARRFEKDSRARAVSEAGVRGEFPIAREAVDLFVTILGAHAGNLALMYRANGGVYLGGGIPPKILPRLESGPAVEAFLDKDRMTDVVRDIPLRVILDDHAALLGAASIALDRAAP
jgi:glucokinase